MATKNLPAKTKTTAVTSWADATKAAAARQVKAASVMGANSAMISFKGATLSIGGVQARNNEAHGIVLCTMNERAYYDGKYNPDEPRTPVCYAYGEVDGLEPVEPHGSCTKPQNELCKKCKHAEWGTADVGRGQACRQSVKFAWITAPANATAADIGDAPIYYGRIPPTSLKAMKVYLEFLGIKDQPSFAVSTKLEVRASSKSIFTVHLEPGADVPRAWQAAILARLEEAQKGIAMPYPVFDEEKPAAKPAGKRRF